MKLIVGLGNPEEKYDNTFHNLGFMVVDEVAKKLGAEFTKTKCKAMISETKIGNEKVIIAKPLTYMNLSGESVTELLSFYKIPLKDFVVVLDDYDLYKGNMRVRDSGSSGTHNGLRNIMALTKSGDFTRIRVGFKPKEKSDIPLINYVLSKISKEDGEIFGKVIDRASDCAIDFAKNQSIDCLMQKYNGEKN